MKKLKKPQIETIENGMKILEIFLITSTVIYRQMHVNQDFMNDFDWVRKTKQHACKTLRGQTTNEENFENFQVKI